MKSVFEKACDKIEKLLDSNKLDGEKYKSHRVAIGTLITNYDENPTRAQKLLDRIESRTKSCEV